jgi:hypothetical protein
MSWNLNLILKRCIEPNLVLNYEKCHFIIEQGIVLGHMVFVRGLKVDKATIDIILSLPFYHDCVESSFFSYTWRFLLEIYQWLFGNRVALMQNFGKGCEFHVWAESCSFPFIIKALSWF